jgi:hypothetical protein
MIELLIKLVNLASFVLYDVSSIRGHEPNNCRVQCSNRRSPYTLKLSDTQSMLDYPRDYRKIALPRPEVWVPRRGENHFVDLQLHRLCILHILSQVLSDGSTGINELRVPLG